MLNIFRVKQGKVSSRSYIFLGAYHIPLQLMTNVLFEELLIKWDRVICMLRERMIMKK